MVGLYDGRKYQLFVDGENLQDLPKHLQKYSLVVTFNGSGFDLRFPLLSFGTNLYRQNSDLSRQVAEAKSDVQKANERIAILQGGIDRLSRTSKQDLPSAEGTKSGKSKKDSP